MVDPPDDLDELLAPPPPAETPGLRAAILQRTQRRLALGRWIRRGGRCAAVTAGVAAVFAAGLGVGSWRAQREAVLVPAPVPQLEVVTVLVPVVVPVGSSGQSPVPAPERTARALELDAEQAAEALTAAGLYRRAGDVYLTAERDYANAARCYRLFLARGGDRALSAEPDDSWLLTSLKNSAFKEKVHATLPDG